MARRKSTSNQLWADISKRLREMAPEHCETIEEAVRHSETLSSAFGMAPASAEDYSFCPTCQRVCWHGVCRVCQQQ